MGKHAWLVAVVMFGCGDDKGGTSTPEVVEDSTSSIATDVSPDDTHTMDVAATDTSDVSAASDSGVVSDTTVDDALDSAERDTDDTNVEVANEDALADSDTSVEADSEVAVDSAGPDADVVSECPTNAAAPWSRRIRPAGGAAVFNELMVTSGVDWIELYNPMVVDIDLSGWRIDGRVSHTFPAGTFLLGRGHLVVAGPWDATGTTKRLTLFNNMDRVMDVLDTGDAPLWPSPGSAQAIAKRDPETLSALAESWQAATPTPNATNFPDDAQVRKTLIVKSSIWQYGNSSGAAPFHGANATTALTLRATADNYMAVFLGGAHGENMRYVGRDDAGGWETVDSYALTPAAGDHLYLAAWELSGDNGGPQMLIAEIADTVATSASSFEWTLGPANAADVPSVATVTTLAGAMFGTPGASAPKSSSPWGGAVGGSFTSAQFIWADTFSDVSTTNTSKTFALFRSRAPIAEPSGTTIAPVPSTLSLTKHFDVSDVNVRLWLTLDVDNGAVVSLNGSEVFRLEPTPGVHRLTTIIPSDALQVGDNVIAVDVTQDTSTQAERESLRFDLALEAESLPPTHARPAESDIVINELMYHPIDPAVGAASDWIELYNRGVESIDLTGWQLVDAVAYRFPDDTVIEPGEYFVLAADGEAMARDYPEVPVAGTFSGGLGNDGERLALLDRCGVLVDEVRWTDGGRWPSEPDGAASSLELKDPFADNARPEAWAASLESDRAGWQTISYRGVAAASPVGPDGQWQEIIIGLLDDGVVLLDDISVTANPGTGNAVQLIRNGGFEPGQGDWQADWNAVGTHERTSVVADPDDASKHVLRLVATGPTEHMHNQLYTPTRNGRSIDNGTTYEISLRARWVSGSDQLNTRLYFNRLPRTTRLGRPTSGGTPGAVNSTVVANLGPTFHDFGNFPVVPKAGEVVVVSVGVDDPDGVDHVTVFAGPDGAALVPYEMTEVGGRWEAVLPERASGMLVQFYVVAVDSRGASASFPPGGPASCALYRADDDPAPDKLHALKILMTQADSDHFHARTNVMSNASTPVTVIYDGRAYYDIGVRAKGSERGRPTTARLGFSVRFDATDPFRGLYHTVSIDRSEGGGGTGQREMMIDQVMAAAGSVSAEYNDLVQLVAPRPEHSGQAGMQVGRFTDEMLANQFEDGDDGELYEYELVYYPASTDDGTATGLKLPQPDNVIGTSHRDLGDTAEAYRHTYLVKNKRGDDDFSRLMAMCKVFGKGDSEFRAQVANVIDVDEWLRAFAFMSLSGATDNYGNGAQHNAQLYVRPDDGKVLLFVHDLDLYPGGADAAIVGNNDLARLLALPGAKRTFYGYLYEMLQGAHTPAMLDRWRTHFKTLLPGQAFDSHYDFMVARRDWIMTNAGNSIAATFPNVTFAITTNGGQDLTSATTNVTLEGDAWIDVREIALVSGNLSFPLVVEWTSDTHWRVALSLGHGANPIAVRAFDAAGNTVGNDTIVVTVTP